ncbi:hypothetical protein RHE_CH01334 [Rhizobium etli CFN 42]|uniref:Uncharacterized protein n=1 Tax=Rhizobium etli (strain ATCC 51251 / DSM 11541 / JCM 21823 / NBRC 15573 / CFN 42) TaxID=347834 RepID=Q2KAJ7_RHIEC|nr:hypothetical protein RHE_CH01334 [Rhizobium etli CFN 42]
MLHRSRQNVRPLKEFEKLRRKSIGVAIQFPGLAVSRPSPPRRSVQALSSTLATDSIATTFSSGAILDRQHPAAAAAPTASHARPTARNLG